MFGTRISGNFLTRDVCGEGCCSHYMPVIIFYHIRKELTQDPQVRENVDMKHFLQEFVLLVQKITIWDNPGIVYYHRNIAYLCTNLRAQESEQTA